MFDYMIGTGLLRLIFGSAFHTPSFQRRLGLVCWLLIALAIAGVGFFRGRAVEADLAGLATDGATAQGVITDKKDEFYRNKMIYGLFVEYTAADQTGHRKRFEVEQKAYDAKSIGGAIPIHYIRSRPDTFYIVGDEPLPADAALMHYFLIGGLAATAVAFAMLVMMWGGGEDAREIPTPPPSQPPGRRDTAPPTRTLGPDGRPSSAGADDPTDPGTPKTKRATQPEKKKDRSRHGSGPSIVATSRDRF